MTAVSTTQVTASGFHLRDGRRLQSAASRELAGPHVLIAERLYELALGPYRGRGMVAVPELDREPAFAGVADAAGEAGIHAALALPLVAGGEAIGLLAAYPDRASDASGGSARTTPGGPAAVRVPAGATGVTAPFIASVWQVDARPGMRVARGDKLAALEAMKMETIIAAPHDGTVAEVYTAVGTQVAAGQVLLALVPDRPDRDGPGPAPPAPVPAR